VYPIQCPESNHYRQEEHNLVFSFSYDISSALKERPLPRRISGFWIILHSTTINTKLAIMDTDYSAPRICTPIDLLPDVVDTTSETFSAGHTLPDPPTGSLPRLSEPRIAVLKGKTWPLRPGITRGFIGVSFFGNPSKELTDRILSHLNAWHEYCIIRFLLVSDNADIRIAFNSASGDGTVKGGYWSYHGTDAKLIPLDQPTMNLEAWSLNISDSECRRVIRHEAGHALGFPHEHLRAEIVDRIDRAKALDYYLTTEGWDEAKTVANVLTPLNPDDIVATDLDTLSIMCYHLPASIMKDGVAVTGGLDINATDASLARLVYGGPIPTTP
jgi:hypothetical protein